MKKKCGNGVSNILSCHHSLLHHRCVMFMRDVALPYKRIGPNLNSFSLSPMF